MPERRFREPLDKEHQHFRNRQDFMKLPALERWRILEEQARMLHKHYVELTEPEELGGGDFFE